MSDTASQPEMFTAAQLAAALGISPRQMRREIGNTSPDGQRVIQNKETKLWRIASLPASLRARLESAASANGYRDVAALLAGPPAWQPEVALAECAAGAVQKAIKLRDALATPLALREDTSRGRAEFEQIGLRDYRAAFGHDITGRHWWNLFNRTLERAQGNDDFGRLELYLDERPARQPQAAPLPADGAEQFPEIARHIERCRDPNELTETNQCAIWLAALESYAGAVELGGDPRTVKEQVLGFLHLHVPALAPTRDALRMAFNRRLARWQDTDGRPSVLRDRRAEANQKRAIALPQEDMDLLSIYAVEACGGRVSQAWRECLRDGLLSEQTAGRFLSNPQNKSHVPAIVRKAVKYEVPLLLEEARRPKHARDNGAWIDRSWDSITSLSWYCSDDVTLPVYFYVPDGKGWFTLMRGQFLLNICARTTAILSYALIPEKGYNARVIRTLMTKTFEERGLPRRGFYWERGIWKDSRILTGAVGDAALDWNTAELGLQEFGLRFIHAIRARSKPVERVAGALQNLMEGDPGYAGRAEMSDPIEAFKDAKRQVESWKFHPAEKFYSLDQWEARLAELSECYNAEPQQGKHTRGLSPEDALEMFRSKDDPPVIPDARWRFLLAHHKRPVLVTANGITLRFGKQVFNYRNEMTGQLRGQTVLAWFNPDAPEVLAVTDLERRDPFCVERSQSVPALDAPEELLAQELGRCEAHMDHAKTRYRVLKARHAPQFRRNLVAPSTERLGAEIEQQRGELEAGRRERETKLLKAQRLARRLGRPMSTLASDLDRAIAGMEMQIEALGEMREDQ